MKKFGKFLSGLIMFCLLICVIGALLVVTLGDRSEDGTVSFRGYQARKVLTDSMAECKQTNVSKYSIKSIPSGSIVLIKLVPEGKEAANKWYDDLKVGDVLTFRYEYNGKSYVITHRITSISENENNGYTIELAGDNKNSTGTQLTQTVDTSNPESGTYVIGKVRAVVQIPAKLLRALQSPVGILIIFVVGGSIVAIINLIASAIDHKDKKKQSKKGTKTAPAKKSEPAKAPKKKVKVKRLPDDIEYDENGWAKY